MMDRREFLHGLVGGIAVAAAVREWPFRVFSFPTEIVRPELSLYSKQQIEEAFRSWGLFFESMESRMEVR